MKQDKRRYKKGNKKLNKSRATIALNEENPDIEADWVEIGKRYKKEYGLGRGLFGKIKGEFISRKKEEHKSYV